VLGRWLGWRWGRLIGQTLLLLVAALIIYDGFTGPQLASTNSATVLAWVHYRGLVLLALLLVGNLFCFACPFTLPRTLARKLSIAGPRWPAALRNKWVSIGGLFLIFLLYEWLDLWASPWLTAWIAVAYFVASFALEAIFSESAFCLYVCPLGAFNFVYSSISPFQITERDRQVCQQCQGKECINGSPQVPGCGTELFVPQIESNMNCTLCLDCARACPYDNVALARRKPWKELSQLLPARWDLAFLLTALAFMGFFNAFGMVSPVYRVQSWLANSLGVDSILIQLLIIFTGGMLLLPGAVLFASAWLSRRLTPNPARRRSRMYAARYAPAFIPMGLGIWLAHYGFHFFIGALTIVPTVQSLLLDHGLGWLGSEPNWALGTLIPTDWIFPFQLTVVIAGFLLALITLGIQGKQHEAKPTTALKQILPWALALTLLTIASLSVFNLPMEMRGAIGG
jgi:ferredoxin